jgi:hypothetical protein
MNIPIERINALATFGYTERESEFLYTVATFSGFFVQRQFASYLGIKGRGPVTDLIAKALQQKHAREYSAERGARKMYHLFSHSLYAAIGKENSRNRKVGRYGLLDKPSIRILTLDFVLAHAHQRYLEEEADKVEYFTKHEHVSLDAIPSQTFVGKNGSLTRRHFIERFPIFVSDSAASSSVALTYIEDEVRSLQTFGSFLQRHRPLLQAGQGRFKLIFASDSALNFPSVERLFRLVFSPVQNRRQTQQLKRFFWLRKMAEEKRFKELAHRDVIEWQRGVKRYSAPEYEQQYEVWRKTGTLPELTVETPPQIKIPEFETYLISPYWVRRPVSGVLEAAPSDAPLNAPRQPAQEA